MESLRKLILVSISIFMLSCKETKSPSESFPSLKVLNTYSNGKISLNSYRFEELEKRISIENDTTYVVNFWATWCAPCVKELPYFEKANELFKEEKVKIILVNLDFPRHIESRLLPFIEKHQLRSEVPILDDPDANSWINKIDPNWDGDIPVTIIHNRHKKVFFNQAFNEEELIEIIQNFSNK